MVVSAAAGDAMALKTAAATKTDFLFCWDAELTASDTATNTPRERLNTFLNILFITCFDQKIWQDFCATHHEHQLER